MKILYDGDIFLYKHCQAAEEIFSFGEDLQTIVSDSREARQKMEIHIECIRKDLEKWLGHSLDILIAFSSGSNFRKTLLPSYKAKRLDKLKPTSFKPVKEWFLKNYECKVWDGLEADDVLGILSTVSFDDCIVVSTDKDLQSIPGFLYNFEKHKAPHLISRIAADYFHMFQALMGDRVDGYFGCPLYGPVKAYRALGPVIGSTVPDLWARVLKAYRASGISDVDATIQAKVARILRQGEWDFEKRVSLWEPPMLVDDATTLKTPIEKMENIAL